VVVSITTGDALAPHQKEPSHPAGRHGCLMAEAEASIAFGALPPLLRSSNELGGVVNCCCFASAKCLQPSCLRLSSVDLTLLLLADGEGDEAPVDGGYGPRAERS
jgi:hypothetical protein